MQIKLEITGKTPLLCHNIALADPDNPIVQQIKTYTAKRTKTEDDRHAVERLEWFGGLYLDNGIPVIPTGAIRKSFVNAGKISKQGTQVTRSLNFADLHVPIAYDGPTDLEELYARPEFTSRLAVGLNGKRVMRVRPQFQPWALTVDALLLEDVMDPEDLHRIADRAGAAEGLGDNRVNGYGRFSVRVIS